MQHFWFLYGWQNESEQERKSAQIYSILFSHYEEVLTMKEQVQMIKVLLAA